MVGAEVGEAGVAEAEDLAVLANGDLELADLVAAVGGGGGRR